jgi:hypothetical protein
MIDRQGARMPRLRFFITITLLLVSCGGEMQGAIKSLP